MSPSLLLGISGDGHHKGSHPVTTGRVMSQLEGVHRLSHFLRAKIWPLENFSVITDNIKACECSGGCKHCLIEGFTITMWLLPLLVHNGSLSLACAKVTLLSLPNLSPLHFLHAQLKEDVHMLPEIEITHITKGSTKCTLCGIVLFKLNTFFCHVFTCP
jgi:hypothetical protein